MAKTEEKSLKTPMKNYIPRSEYNVYMIAALGQSLVYSCMSGYITDYYMSVMRLSPIFVLLLMLLARVWDAINDPFMGRIVDRHTMKWGRMRPYAAIVSVPLAIFTVLLFWNPGLTGTIMYIYAAVVYVFWGMINTMADVPFWGCANVMTPNPEERGKLVSFGHTWGGIGTGIATILPLGIGMVLAKAGGMDATTLEQNKYLYSAIVASVIGMSLFALSSFKVKERIQLPNAPKKVAGERSVISRIFHCKPLMLVVLMGVLSFGRYMLQAAAVHVGRYGFYMGPDTTGMTTEQLQFAAQASISKVTMIIQASVAVGMFGAMVVLPFLYKWFNYKQLVIYTCIGGFVADVLSCIVGWTTQNLYICIPFLIIASIPLGVINVVSYAMVCDSLDYMEWETGYRDNGLGSACQSFVNKLGNAMTTVVIILMYMAMHIDIEKMYGDTGGNPIFAFDLTAGQNFAMFSLVTLIPGISLLLCSIPIFFYDIVGEKKERITRELAQQRAAKGIVIE
ncbi:MAG: MFS transporter [Oscillospiraceae bacterium]|nr:MFS transporter [Oscillospiraceae bacterium]